MEKNKTKSKTNFDLSNLSLQELIKVYESISSFLAFLEENKLDEGDASDE